MNNNNFSSKYTFFNLEENERALIESILYPCVNNISKIEDSRKLIEFKQQTFGGYKKTQVSSNMDNAIVDSKIENAVQMSFQLLFSGVVEQLWDKLYGFASKNISIQNPRLPFFLYNRLLKWNKIVSSGKFKKDSIFFLRNHNEVRNMLVEMVVILCLSKKRKIDNGKKIKKSDFIIDNFKKNLESPNTNIIDKVSKRGDPSEMRIAINEFGYHIVKGNMHKIIFWLNWVLEWDKKNKKKYTRYDCASRYIEGVDKKYHTDVIWLIWDVINYVKDIKLNNGDDGYRNKVNKQIGYLWKLFTYEYTSGLRTRRIPLIIWSINYLINYIDWKINLIDRPHILFQTMLNIDKMIINMKSQQINRGFMNNRIMNIAVQNNYMVPEKHHQYDELKIKKEKVKQQKEIDKFRKMKELEAKKKKVNVNTMDKLNALNEIDKQNIY